MQVQRRIAVGARRPLAVLSGWALATLILDRLTKWWVSTSVQPYDSIPVIKDVFHITFVRNTGAAFGLMPGKQPLFILTSSVVLLGIVGYVWLMRPAATWLNVSLGMIAGGAFGNLIDRVVTGRVVDFFDLVAIEFPVFNIADSAIVVGTSMLVAWVLFGPESEHARRPEPDDAVGGVPADASGGDGTHTTEFL